VAGDEDDADWEVPPDELLVTVRLAWLCFTGDDIEDDDGWEAP
jgi:hypothetical protein